jgi:hypothetical protein
VLLESFTNTNSWDAGDYQEFKEFVDDKLGDEIVKVDYHVSFPNIDPFNQANQSDPGARALYYNISAVPQVCLDGMIPEDVASGRPNQDFASWNTFEFNKRVLELADATINANIGLNADGEITISGDFTPFRDMPGNTILHVAVIEENIPVDENEDLLSGTAASGTTTFAYVLRKLLPSASGTKYSNLLSGITHTFGEGGELTWSSPSLFKPQDDIAVVLFLQDEETKVIYQSRIYRSIADPAGVTGINDPEFAMNFYPNPSDNEPLLMYDQLGHLVSEAVFEKGESSKKVSTNTLAGGVYLIKIDTSEGSVIKKMMVVHKN